MGVEESRGRSEGRRASGDRIRGVEFVDDSGDD